VCGVTGWFRRNVVVAGAVLVLGASGCTGDSGKGPVDPPLPPSTPASPVPSVSPTGTAEDQILAQYRRFWTETLPAAQSAPPEARRSILAAAAMEPALRSLLDGIRDLDRTGEKAYGHLVPVGETLKRRRDIALVTGCLDSSEAGTTDAKSGRVVSRGPGREAVLVTLKAGEDSVWRVYQTGFPKDQRC
jgi:hypothetical protein